MCHKVLLFALLASSIMSCRHADIKPYHSTASVPRQVWSTNSEMEAVDCLSNTEAAAKIAVVASVDEKGEPKSTSYLLFAPLVSEFNSSTDFSNILVNQGAVVLRPQIVTLTTGLKRCIDRWDATLTEQKAEFWEFISSPEIQQEIVNDSVVNSRVYLRLAYNRTSNGSHLIVYLSEADYRFVWRTDEKEVAKCLLEKIESASALLSK